MVEGGLKAGPCIMVYMHLAIDGNEANVTRRVGSNVFAYEVIKRLPSLLDTGDSATLYLKSPPQPDLSAVAGLDIRVIRPGRFWTRFRFPLELYRARRRIDVLFSPGHYAPQPCPVSSVISIMDLAFFRYKRDFLRRDYHQLVNWTENSVNQASHIIAISNSTKADIIKRYHYPADDITVCPLSHDKKIFNPTATGIRPNTIPQNTDRFILYVGTLQPRKNISTLIRAFAGLASTDQQTKLVIAGKKGWLYQNIYDLVIKLNLVDKVIFTGFVASPELVWLYRHAVCFVLPSLYEGFGIPVLEAMACGCPVITSRVSSLPEVGGQAAIYLDNPTDTKLLAGLLAQTLRLAPSARQKQITAGLAQAEKFSWDQTTKIVYQVLQSESLLV